MRRLILLTCLAVLPACDDDDAAPTDASVQPDASADASARPECAALASRTGYEAAWAEFLDDDGVRASFSLLCAHGVALHLAWPAARLDDAALLDVAADAQAAGVVVRPWLLLADEDGYWPGSTNAEAFATAARQLMEAWTGRGLEPSGLIVDMEMRIDRALMLTDLIGGDMPDLAGLVSFLREGVDRDQFAAATATYAALADDAHASGWTVILTTLPMVLDDPGDGDDTIVQALGIPVDGIAWDRMTFQAYRTLLGNFSIGDGPPLTPFVVYDYARTAIELYGERAGMDLGLVGTGVGGNPTYPDASELRADVEAAQAAGIPASRIHVYNLDGILERTPSEAWLTPPPDPPVAPEEGAGTVSLRGTIRALDATN